jgi:hypothetical protein
MGEVENYFGKILQGKEIVLRDPLEMEQIGIFPLDAIIKVKKNF